MSDLWISVHMFFKRLSGVGSEPVSSQFHWFSHFHHITAEPQRLPMSVGTFVRQRHLRTRRSMSSLKWTGWPDEFVKISPKK
jgi:hypothetical protein